MNKIMSKCLKTAQFSVCNTSSIQKTKSKVFLIFNLIAIGEFFIMFSILFASLSSADLYLNSKVGSIYFNTTGIARASIGPGGNFSINTSDLFVNNNLGRVGIGTTNPTAKLTLTGLDSNQNGPHFEIYTSEDSSNRVTQLLSWDSDDIALSFGAYYNSQWKSSDAGSNAIIYKYGDKLRFSYDSGVTAGSAIQNPSTGTKQAMVIDLTNGQVGIGTATPLAALHVNDSTGSVLLGFGDSDSYGVTIKSRFLPL